MEQLSRRPYTRTHTHGPKQFYYISLFKFIISAFFRCVFFCLQFRAHIWIYIGHLVFGFLTSSPSFWVFGFPWKKPYVLIKSSLPPLLVFFFLISFAPSLSLSHCWCAAQTNTQVIMTVRRSHHCMCVRFNFKLRKGLPTLIRCVCRCLHGTRYVRFDSIWEGVW